MARKKATAKKSAAKKSSAKKSKSSKQSGKKKPTPRKESQKTKRPVPVSRLKNKSIYECLKLDEQGITDLNAEISRVKRLIKNYRGQLLDRKGVQGIGVGLREAKTSKTGKTIGFTNEVVIQIFVEKKLDAQDLPDWKKFPTVLGRSKIPVDIIEMGKITKTATVAKGGMGIQRTDKKVGRGTLGAIVFRGDQPYALTNAHVVFEKPKEAITKKQTASVDLIKGNRRFKLGTCDAGKDAAYTDGVDAALIKIKTGVDYSLVIDGVTQDTDDEPNSLAGHFVPGLGTRVLKRGFKSGDVQVGTVTSISGEFSFGNETFGEQIVITGDGFFQPEGDSGSVAVYEDNRRRCIGLLHGGSPTGRGIASRFVEVIEEIPGEFEFFEDVEI